MPIHPSVDRRRLVLEVVGAEPGIHTHAVAAEVGIPLVSAYHILTELSGAGKIEQWGDGWRVSENPPGGPTPE